MKTNLSLAVALLFSALLTSCSTTFYQVYRVTPSPKLATENNNLEYEDENCKVIYNLWDEGGNIGFIFYNKTDKNIYLNLEESFFVLNGIAYDYFRDRVYTNTKNSGITTSHYSTESTSATGTNYLNQVQTNGLQATNNVSLTSLSGYSISYKEEKIICIPSKTSKIIKEYNINESLYRDCDLYIFPTKSQISTKTFSEDESPLVFSNRISYRLDQSDNIIKIENRFYASEITNFPESEITEVKYGEFCGQKDVVMTKYIKGFSPDKFYIKYNKGQYYFKH